MLPSELVNKPLHEWTVESLNLIVERQSEESQFLEFKEYMPVKNQGLGWNFNGILHANQRDGLAKEIVAFANTYGGHLIVGIKETEEKPSRAEKLGDLNTEVAELAERLRSALGSIIDPPINGLTVHPIVATANGSGFLVIHVPQSIHAPHGFGKPPEAYVRRADRSEPMTMRDLQNVFWEARTKKERIASELESLRQRIVSQTPSMGRIRVGIFAVSETPCLISEPSKIVSINDADRWSTLYKVRSGAVAIQNPDNIGGLWTSNHAGLTGTYTESRRSGTWEIDDSGVISIIYDMEGKRSHATNSDGRNFFESHPVWHLNSLKIFIDFLKLTSKICEPKCNKWVIKICILTSQYGENLIKFNDWGESVLMGSNQFIEVRPVEIDVSAYNTGFEFLERKFWAAFCVPEEYRNTVLDFQQ